MFRLQSLPAPLFLILLLIFSIPAGAAALNIAKPGSGFGIIASNPTGINCGADCSGSFSTGSAITLTATPDANSSFVNWLGACAGQNSTCAINASASDQTTAGYFSGAAIAASGGHTVALKSDGTVWTWGDNLYGQLGDGTNNTSRSTPVPVSGLSNVLAIAVGWQHTVALKNDGTVWAWGYNGSGALGDGSRIDRLTPVQVSGLSNVLAIAADGYHTVALKNDGTVWAWGNNLYGQLGDSTFNNIRTTPVQVSALSNILAIAAGAYHTIVLKNDGTVWAWGRNDSGQLGDGTTTDRTIPVQVVSGLRSNVLAISAGADHTIVLKNDGTVWAWGYNLYGQLGDGTTTNRTTPVPISSLSNVLAIAAGEAHTMSLKSDGTVWAWGSNGWGQLGDGTTTSRTMPVPVSGLSNVLAIATGGIHTVALKNDGTVWAWGRDYEGQLGDGTTTFFRTMTPVQVHGVEDVGFLNLFGSSGSCQSTIAVGATVAGNWSADCDSTHRSGRYAKFYTLTLSAPQTVVMNLSSATVDTYLYLLSGSGTEGTVLAENDDFGEGVNSQITAPLAAGAYTLETTTYGSGQTGAFSLSVQGSASVTYPLTVTKSGSGSGTVNSNPEGINNCGATCTANFASGTSVTLTATPASGSTFAGWSGACAHSTESCTVSMSVANSVTATFNSVVTFALTSPGRVTEGSPLIFTLSASAASTAAQTFNISVAGEAFLTLDGRVYAAATLADFAPLPTTVTLPSGQTTATLTITPINDGITEGTEGFRANVLSGVTLVAQAPAFIDDATLLTYPLTITKVGAGSGTVSSSPSGINNCGATCTANFASGTSVTLTATPASGSTFAGWSGACTSSTGSCTVSMSAANSVTATFNPVTYALTVTKSGSGSGTVNSNPAGINNCGATCTANFASGTSVTLTATPASGSTFAGWSGACTHSTGSCTVSMSAANSVTATFNPVTYALTVTKAGTGSGTVGGGGNYAAGAAVYLTATANSGSTFTGWSPSPCASNFAMPAQALTCTATFTVTYALTVTKSGSGSGTVSSSPSGITCGSDCNESYASGTSVTLTATPASGSTFAGWSGACASSTGSCTVSMSAANSVTATFNPAPYALTVAKAGSGSGTVGGGGNYAAGAAVNLTATANSGSTFAGWSPSPCATSFAMPTSNLTCTATFNITATGNDIVPLQASSPAVIGAGSGDDTYILDPSLLTSARTFTLIDAQGSNVIQLAAGLQIASSAMTSNALQLTLSNGARIDVYGANRFNYAVCGNAAVGLNPTPVTFTAFASATLGVSVPTSASMVVTGGAVTVTCDVSTALYPRIDFVSDQMLLFNGIGQSANLQVRVFDAAGQEIPNAQVSWSSSGPDKVMVTATGSLSARVDALANWSGSITLTATYAPLNLSVQAQAVMAVLAPNAVLASSNQVLDISGDRAGIHQIILARTTAAEALAVGQVIVTGDQAGVMVHILGVTLESSRVVLRVEPASITDAFQDIDISTQSEPMRLHIQASQGNTTMTLRSLPDQAILSQQVLPASFLDLKDWKCERGLDLISGELKITDIDLIWDITTRTALKIQNRRLIDLLLLFGGQAGITANLTLKLAAGVTVSGQCSYKPEQGVSLGAMQWGPISIQPELVNELGIKASYSTEGALERSLTLGRIWQVAGIGIRYTNVNGWQKIADYSVQDMTDKGSLEFTESRQIKIEPFANYGLNLDFGLGLSKFSYDLASIKFFGLAGSVYYQVGTDGPVDSTLKEYVGPTVEVGVKAEGKVTLQDGDVDQNQDAESLLAEYLPVEFPTFEFVVLSEQMVLYQTAKPTGSVVCNPSCDKVDNFSNVTLTATSTDTTTTGLVEFWASRDGASQLSRLAIAAFSGGRGEATYKPDSSTEPGRYTIYLRLWRDGGQPGYGFPLASEQPIGEFSISGGCVEGQIIQVNGVDRYRLVGNDCSIVRDIVTGLEWQRCGVGQTWNASTQSCDGNHSLFTWEQSLMQTAPGGFHLPNITQLRSLVYCPNTGVIGMWADRTPCGEWGTYQPPTIVEEAFPNNTWGWFWSSSPDDLGWRDGWGVSFGWGLVGVNVTPGADTGQVRLVRGGQ